MTTLHNVPVMCYHGNAIPISLQSTLQKKTMYNLSDSEFLTICCRKATQERGLSQEDLNVICQFIDASPSEIEVMCHEKHKFFVARSSLSDITTNSKRLLTYNCFC